MKQGIIALIPKPDKDPKTINNRLKTNLHKIIGDSQSGFMKNRSIHNNIRLALNLLNYRQVIVDDGFIFSLTFTKPWT